MHTFYICSYGGSGSKYLTEKLKRYGKVNHIHSRHPPKKLEYIGRQHGGRTYFEWFNGIKIPNSQLKNYTVIYIYRNPVKAILSRFSNPVHLDHIQTRNDIKISNVKEQKKDLYNIEEFFDNYTTKDPERNYKIICIKYEDMFNNSKLINKILNVNIHLEKSKNYSNKEDEELDEIYKDLILKMNSKESVEII